MVSVRLYVKSNRTTLITSRVSVETMGGGHTTADYSEGSTLVRYSPDEELARLLLKRSRVDFEIVDLSKNVGTKLLARLKGITRTPTLAEENGSGRRFVGIKEIQKFLAEEKN